jgi:Tol biopolymer transport system component
VKEAVQLTYGGLEKDPVGTDASKLYLNMWDQRAIALMPVAGGQIATIPVSLPGFGDLGKEPPGQVPKLMDISPDSSSLLVLDRGDMPLPEVWVVGASGQPAHYLVKATNAAWSPDGKSVVYATAHGDISLIPAEGGAPRLIASTRSTANGKTIRDLSFSPDGHTIRFTQANALWEMASDGTSFHQLLQSWNPSWWKCCGRWTPDGQFFVFLSGSIVLKSPLFLPGAQLWAIDQRIGRFRSPIQEPVQLTSGPILWGAPTPGRDSHRIFARGVTLRSRLVRYYKQSNQLEPLLGGISAEFVDFSADRKYVAYVSFPDGILWRANRDGSGAVQLTKPPFYPKLIHWSPDGTQILFTDFSPSGMEEAYVVSSLGGVPMRVLPEDNGPQRDAGWSPDGARIVFSSGSGAQGTESDEQELRILDLGSHTITSLADSEGMSSPQWSPDGRYIAALTIGGAELTAFDLQAQKWTTLRSGHYPQFPVWSRDSHSIYFLRYQDHGVFRISISGGIAERVFDLKDFRHTGWYNNWLGLDPEDSPLLLRDLGSSEIYSLTLE